MGRKRWLWLAACLGLTGLLGCQSTHPLAVFSASRGLPAQYESAD